MQPKRDESRPVQIREWAAFGFASSAMLLSLFNLYQSQRDRARTELAEANQILNEVWDALGGEPRLLPVRYLSIQALTACHNSLCDMP